MIIPVEPSPDLGVNQTLIFKRVDGILVGAEPEGFSETALIPDLARVLMLLVSPAVKTVELTIHHRTFLAATHAPGKEREPLRLALHARALAAPAASRALLWEFAWRACGAGDSGSDTDDRRDPVEKLRGWLQNLEPGQAEAMIRALEALERPSGGIAIVAAWSRACVTPTLSPLDLYRYRELLAQLPPEVAHRDAWESNFRFGRYLALKLRGLRDRFTLGDSPGAVIGNLLWSWPGAVVELAARLFAALFFWHRTRHEVLASGESWQAWQEHERARPVPPVFGRLRVGVSLLLLSLGLALAGKVFLLRFAPEGLIAWLGLPAATQVAPARWMADVLELSPAARDELSRRLGAEAVGRYFAAPGGERSNSGEALDPRDFLKQVGEAIERSSSQRDQLLGLKTLWPLLERGSIRERLDLLDLLSRLPAEIWAEELAWRVETDRVALRPSRQVDALIACAQTAGQSDRRPARVLAPILAGKLLGRPAAEPETLAQRRWALSALAQALNEPAQQARALDRLTGLLAPARALDDDLLRAVASVAQPAVDDFLVMRLGQLASEEERSAWDKVVKEETTQLSRDESAARRTAGYRRLVKLARALPERYFGKAAEVLTAALRSDDAPLSRPQVEALLVWSGEEAGRLRALIENHPRKLTEFAPLATAALAAKVTEAGSFARSLLAWSRTSRQPIEEEVAQERAAIFRWLLGQAADGDPEAFTAVRALLVRPHVDLARVLAQEMVRGGATNWPRRRQLADAFLGDQNIRFDFWLQNLKLTASPERAEFFRELFRPAAGSAEVTDRRFLWDLAWEPFKSLASYEESLLVLQAAMEVLRRRPASDEALPAVRTLAEWLDRSTGVEWGRNSAPATDKSAPKPAEVLQFLLERAPQLEPAAFRELQVQLVAWLSGAIESFRDEAMLSVIVNELERTLTSGGLYSRRAVLDAFAQGKQLGRLGAVPDRRTDALVARLAAGLLRAYALIGDPSRELGRCGGGVLLLGQPALVRSHEISELAAEVTRDPAHPAGAGLRSLLPYWLLSPDREVRSAAGRLTIALLAGNEEDYPARVLLLRAALSTGLDLSHIPESARRNLELDDQVKFADLDALRKAGDLGAFQSELEKRSIKPSLRPYYTALFASRLLAEGTASQRQTARDWLATLDAEKLQREESLGSDLIEAVAMAVRLALSPESLGSGPAADADAGRLLQMAVRLQVQNSASLAPLLYAAAIDLASPEADHTAFAFFRAIPNGIWALDPLVMLLERQQSGARVIAENLMTAEEVDDERSPSVRALISPEDCRWAIEVLEILPWTLERSATLRSSSIRYVLNLARQCANSPPRAAETVAAELSRLTITLLDRPDLTTDEREKVEMALSRSLERLKPSTLLDEQLHSGLFAQRESARADFVKNHFPRDSEPNALDSTRGTLFSLLLARYGPLGPAMQAAVVEGLLRIGPFFSTDYQPDLAAPRRWRWSREDVGNLLAAISREDSSAIQRLRDWARDLPADRRRDIEELVAQKNAPAPTGPATIPPAH